MVINIATVCSEVLAVDSGNPEMFTADFIREESMRMVRECAWPAEGLSIKAQKRRASRRLGWSFNRTEDVWYGEARINPEEFLTLQWRAARVRERAEQRLGWANEIRQKVERAFPHHGVASDGPLVGLARGKGRTDSR